MVVDGCLECLCGWVIWAGGVVVCSKLAPSLVSPEKGQAGGEGRGGVGRGGASNAHALEPAPGDAVALRNGSVGPAPRNGI